MVRAATRGVTVRVLVDGWGAKHYLTKRLERQLVAGGVNLLKHRPEVQPWHFRSHRLRRLHRKLCHVDTRVAFVGASGCGKTSLLRAGALPFLTQSGGLPVYVEW